MLITSPWLLFQLHRKGYILDSWLGKHTSVAADFVNKTKTYLITNHNMDIAAYPEKTAKVCPQSNNFDYGFHVLLYIQGFHEMEIYNFNKKEVLKFRKKLSIDLRFHRMNTIPAIIPVKEVVTVDEDEDGDEELTVLSPLISGRGGNTINTLLDEGAEENEENISGNDTGWTAEKGTSGSAQQTTVETSGSKSPMKQQPNSVQKRPKDSEPTEMDMEKTSDNKQQESSTEGNPVAEGRQWW